jgi:hypothetical protein
MTKAYDEPDTERFESLTIAVDLAKAWLSRTEVKKPKEVADFLATVTAKITELRDTAKPLP